jgi:NAD(P)H-dependent flavin oxidoreductase YrpB (nitropropane dioxygenase family)
MGVGISSAHLAREVAMHGGLGVVSGVAPDLLLARWLQDGDADGRLRAAMVDYPDQDFVARTVRRYHRPDGRPRGTPYRPIQRLDHHQRIEAVRLTALGMYLQVRLAKSGHDGPVGVNLLEKIQAWTPAALLGAVLADVDVVLVGAGLPTHLPRILDDLSACDQVTMPMDVANSTADDDFTISLDPTSVIPGLAGPLTRPVFLAIVSSHVLGAYLARDDATRPDGLVVEGPVAGGHNAPPRRLQLDDRGEPLYGPRDVVDLEKLRSLGLPFWLAGGQAGPVHLEAARAAGANGVQVGTVFALSADSGVREPLREALLSGLRRDQLKVRTDPAASPTGFPFKVVQMPGTMADPAAYESRGRICDLGYLRSAYRKPDGSIGQRCPAEPVDAYVRKGGDVSDTEGRMCLCNGLTATAGLPQWRGTGAEPPVLTLGKDLESAEELLSLHPNGWRAADVMRWITQPLMVSAQQAG